MATNKVPLGIELVKKGTVTQEDISKALEYQKSHPDEKIGDILYKLKDKIFSFSFIYYSIVFVKIYFDVR